ncbi:hypothetical protein BN946_scf184902.g29 [Trametes cinnabarina]|uniref:NADH:flavin oxidoreductase/NADH oxidase N-terminal domain-containing protein n=1 Tax=Pycnoporus cinnabarinus TaxID=5643 RepID=A0A060SSY2_PYCCI|nr:hypothetical protein BN946_scf184902.g29 [Trametes cinnabarina]
MAAPNETVPKLFQPVKVGDMTLAHRVVMAPLTRYRATEDFVHTDMAITYYAQRASTPGTLLMRRSSRLLPAYAVHAQRSYIFLQLWALGRAADLAELKKVNPEYPYVSASDIPIPEWNDGQRPGPLTKTEIKEYVETYAQAARNAVHGAGFDGVEVHSAHGYLLDQFLQDVSNKRTDEYGGSIANRCRFPLEVIDAVTKAVGEEKVALRISMRMDDPVPTFSYFISQIAERHPRVAYVHVVEPGVAGNKDIEKQTGEVEIVCHLVSLEGTLTRFAQSNDFIRKIWLPRPLVSAGRYTRESAIKRAEETGELTAFGRLFISNPDLPYRLRHNLPLTNWDRALYYNRGDPHGYIDYSFADGNPASSRL